ncbi:hypothetical protein OFEAOIEE_LOCUS3971 [Methylorubrum extorquens]
MKFAIPNGEPGSGMTFITGPNNSGKSSIIEAIRARSGYSSVSFTAGTRNAALEFVEINYIVNGNSESIRSVSKGSSETIRADVDPSFRIFVLPSRRSFSPYFTKHESNRFDYITNSPLPAQRSSSLQYFEQRLFKALKSPDSFNDMLEKVLGKRPEWTIDLSDQGQYFLKFFNNSTSHSSDGMGEGIVSIFAIVDALYDSEAGETIIIDEPELSLHPSLQKKLAKLLIEMSSDRQIIISTHSPYFVDLRSLLTGGRLVRVSTQAEGTRIHELSDESVRAINQLSTGNLYNPHVFGLDARELFFQEDQIILTEGQEDVLLYPKIAKQIGIEIPGDFFGWGVGGASNMNHLCLILRDLGFRKVAGLLDGDKVQTKNSLSTYFPDFYFACIPAKDIRTKKARGAIEAVDGLLDKDLNLKEDFKPQVAEIFSELAGHMRA